MKALIQVVSITLLLLLTPVSQAIITGELIMIRSEKAFPEAMRTLQDAIRSQGYVMMGVQPVDERLSKRGFKTDKYRIVFFGKTEQNKHLSDLYPELVPYLPLKIVIYAEADETLLVTADPAAFIDLYPHPGLRNVFRQWHEDMLRIMKTVQAE